MVINSELIYGIIETSIKSPFFHQLSYIDGYINVNELLSLFFQLINIKIDNFYEHPFDSRFKVNLLISINLKF